MSNNSRIFFPQIMRDPDTGNSKGYAFINFASFEASDVAIEAMNGQYLCNRPITISYAFKKDSKGERHGSAAGKLLNDKLCVPVLTTNTNLSCEKRADIFIVKHLLHILIHVPEN